MSSIQHKLDVLSKIGNLFNNENITWAVGASLLLYFEGITDSFNDIDILIDEKDIPKAKQLILSVGKLYQPAPNPQFTTKYFYECIVDDVEIDLMGGFAIVFDGKEHDCSLDKKQIARYTEVNGVTIPLQALSCWRDYYRLMKRDVKAALIDNHLN